MGHSSILKKALAGVMLLCSAMTVCAEGVTGTLPVIYVNTNNGEKPTTKEYYLDATYYIDPAGTDFEAVGTAEAPLPTGIKARGNYTWHGFDKKPYKLKLESKTGLLGMKKNKHYALLAHADDNCGFLRNTIGFELSRRLGLAWTPTQQPVEFVFNGEYQGLYFLTETIRVDKTRVNIVEQPDNTTDESLVSGGWLVEIDNYDADPHVTVTEGGSLSYPIWFTYKTPEILSAEQTNYLTSQMSRINDLLYAEDKTDSSELEAMVDFDCLARFYLVQELTDNRESFHGSCYLTRELGDGNKWKFGPVWDFGCTFGNTKSDDITVSEFHQVWIAEFLKFPSFRQKVKEVWKEFCDNKGTDIEEFVNNFINDIKVAAESDLQRWPQYGNSDLDNRKDRVLSLFKNYVQTVGQWYEYVPVADVDVFIRGEFNGWGTNVKLNRQSDGTYRAHVDKLTSSFKIASADWKTIDYGAPLNGNKVLTKGEKFKLTAVGSNIELAEDLNDVNVVFDPVNETLLVADYAGVGDIESSEAAYIINGNSIQAFENLAVYTVDGRMIAAIAAGATETLPAGICIIITADGNASKTIIR